MIGTMNPECPACHRPVADRRRAVCLYCGGPIPEEFLFTPEEIAAVNAEMAELELRRLRMREKDEEERRDAARRDGGGDPGTIGYGGFGGGGE